MDIVKACKAASYYGCCIARVDKQGDIRFDSKIRPTNSDDRLCEVMKLDGSNPRRGWQPKLEDLLADDWTVI